MVFLALGLLALLVVGILLAPLGAGIVAVTVVLAVAVVGWVLWGLVWGRSRRRTPRGLEQPEPRGRLEHPELLGPGGPDDPDRTEPVATDETVETGRR